MYPPLMVQSGLGNNRIDCSTNCLFKFRKGCRDIRDCACRCGELVSVNSNIHEACVLDCNSNPSKENVPSGREWMCKRHGCDSLLNLYQIFDECGCDPLDTTQGQNFEDAKKKIANETRTLDFIIGGIGIAIVGLLLNMIFRSSNK